MIACDARCELYLPDKEYPASVRQLASPPPVLYVRGNVSVFNLPMLAIIGSRRASPYGLALAEMAAKIAAESGVAVVSGGARGCDQAAGRSALSAGGKHVMVLGTGADVAYPSSVRPLIERTLKGGGAVVSIEPWGTPPMRWAFPKRNRVIAALSSAVLVTEAGLPSGTFSTAEAAEELGREVLAVPGSFFSPESRGSNYLIANGACCISDEEALEVAISRIFGTLRFERGGSAGVPGLDSQSKRVLDMLVANPMRLEDIALALRMGGSECMQLMGELEVAGAVERLVDGRFSPSKTALHALTHLGHNG
ncbi:MAG: DNA-processing protein DprA [Coriobacteriaceae bacterium]|nr:DNA-processing protein DprA [Coriobacteriaceae bacterium]